VHGDVFFPLLIGESFIGLGCLFPVARIYLRGSEAVVNMEDTPMTELAPSLSPPTVLPLPIFRFS